MVSQLSKSGLRPSPVHKEVEYPASKMWTLFIHTFHDDSSYLANVSSIFKKHQTFDSFEAFLRSIYATRGPSKLSKDNPMTQMCNIAHSATPRYDLIAKPELSSAMTKSLGFKEDKSQELYVQHVLLKNGLNNASFYAADGTKVELKTAIAGSSDRENERLPMARKVAPYKEGETAQKAPSYCYTGRPDTPEKALEQAQMIFFSELESTHRKGIEEKEENGEKIYELTYVVNSLQSNSPLYGAARIVRGKGQAPEHLLFEQEQLALEELKKENKIHEFTYQGETYKVRLKPILFSRQVNMFANLEKTLESSLSGEKAALKATREGWKELKALAEQKLPGLNDKDHKLAQQLIDRLEQSHNGRWIGAQVSAVEELFYRALLVLLLDLPVVYHCKSSIDRTSIFVALHVSLAQWKRLGLSFVENDESLSMLIDNTNFKEIFAINWMQGHQISRNARSAEGVVTDETGKTIEIDSEIMTIFAGKGLDQCPALARLLPESYLKPYGVSAFFFENNKKDRIKNLLIYVGMLTMSSLMLPFLTLMNPNGTLRTPESLPAHVVLSLLRYPVMLLKNYFNLFLNFHEAIPKKVINEDHEEVGVRHLIQATPKHQKPFVKPIQAVPANAKSVEEYTALFNQRFNQIARAPLCHTICGNGFKTLDGKSPAEHFFSRILDAPKIGITMTTEQVSSEIENADKKTKSILHTHTIWGPEQDIGNGIKVRPPLYTIQSTTILNSDPDSEDYGQGVIEYMLTGGVVILRPA